MIDGQPVLSAPTEADIEAVNQLYDISYTMRVDFLEALKGLKLKYRYQGMLITNIYREDWSEPIVCNEKEWYNARTTGDRL